MIVPDARKTMNEHLDAIWAMLEALGDETAVRLTAITDATKQKDTGERELREAEQVLADQLHEIEIERTVAEAELEDLKKAVQRSQTDLEVLQGQKADALIEYNQWSDKIAKFKVYEEQARKVLKTEDTALQTRERAVSEKEQFKPRQSFLPPQE